MSEPIPLKGQQSNLNNLNQVRSYVENINKTGHIVDPKGKEVPVAEILTTLANTITQCNKGINNVLLTDDLATNIKTIQQYVKARIETGEKKDDIQKQFQKVQDIYDTVAASHIFKPK